VSWNRLAQKRPDRLPGPLSSPAPRPGRLTGRFGARRFQLTGLPQDRLLEFAQLPARLDAKLADQRFADAAEGG